MKIVTTSSRAFAIGRNSTRIEFFVRLFVKELPFIMSTELQGSTISMCTVSLSNIPSDHGLPREDVFETSAIQSLDDQWTNQTS